MIKRLNLYDFMNEFEGYGRGSQFSYMGFEALFDFLEAEDEYMELDVIALCCEFTEYENIGQYNDEYNTEHESMRDIEYLVIDIDEEAFICQNH